MSLEKHLALCTRPFIHSHCHHSLACNFGLAQVVLASPCCSPSLSSSLTCFPIPYLSFPRPPPPPQVTDLAAVVAAAKAAYDDRNGRLLERMARLKECDAEIAGATKERDALEGRKTDIVVEKKKLNNK